MVSAAGGVDPEDEEDEVDWATGVKWLFTPAQSQWRNGKTEAVVKCTKQSLRTTFRNIDFDFIDFTTTLRRSPSCWSILKWRSRTGSRLKSPRHMDSNHTK